MVRKKWVILQAPKDSLLVWSLINSEYGSYLNIGNFLLWVTMVL